MMATVSTHSRLKAAGKTGKDYDRSRYRFNTQPPEGGWIGTSQGEDVRKVSTHSRLKAAGRQRGADVAKISVSTHSRLKAAGS